MGDLSDLYNTEQAARYLDISYGRLRSLVAEGRGPVGRKLGKAWVFKRADLDVFKNTPRPPGVGVLPTDDSALAHRRQIRREAARRHRARVAARRPSNC